MQADFSEAAAVTPLAQGFHTNSSSYFVLILQLLKNPVVAVAESKQRMAKTDQSGFHPVVKICPACSRLLLFHHFSFVCVLSRHFFPLSVISQRNREGSCATSSREPALARGLDQMIFGGPLQPFTELQGLEGKGYGFAVCGRENKAAGRRAHLV